MIAGDRRALQRFQCQLELRFTGRKGRYLGHGVTGDLSRRTLRFETENPPSVGDQVEVRIAWPFLLQNICPLELVVRGPVIQVGARGTLVRINSYEFQTCGTRSFTEPPVNSTGWRVA